MTDSASDTASDFVRSSPVPSAWQIERFAGSATEFHARELPSAPFGRLAWWFDISSPAIALGSSQRTDSVVADAGFDVVRRRSGGGAVLLVPDEVVWLDLLIERGDQLWQDDVGRSMWWVGELWQAALAAVGVNAEVWRAPMTATSLSRQVCFAGVGPGEVVIDGRKVVGISQRRTRDAARFQCAVYRSWNPSPLVRAFALTPDEAAALAAVCEPLGDLDIVGALNAVLAG